MMTNLKDLTVLIVDPLGLMGFNYRRSFVAAGADAHVVSNFSAAQKLVETKKISAAILPYAQDAETVGFCRLLALKSVPCIFTSEPLARYPTRRPMSEAVLAVQELLSESGMSGDGTNSPS